MKKNSASLRLCVRKTTTSAMPGVRALAKAAALALALAFAGCTSRVEAWIDGYLVAKHEIGGGKWELVSSERIERADLCTITIVCRRRREAR